MIVFLTTKKQTEFLSKKHTLTFSIKWEYCKNKNICIFFVPPKGVIHIDARFDNKILPVGVEILETKPLTMLSIRHKFL